MNDEVKTHLLKALLMMLDPAQRDELLANLEKQRPINPDPTNSFRVGLNRNIHADIDEARHQVLLHAPAG